MLECVSYAFQTCCSEHDGQLCQYLDLYKGSAREMVSANVLYPDSYAFTHNHKYSWHAGISEHTLAQFLLKYPEVWTVQSAYLIHYVDLPEFSIRLFTIHLCFCTS